MLFEFVVSHNGHKEIKTALPFAFLCVLCVKSE